MITAAPVLVEVEAPPVDLAICCGQERFREVDRDDWDTLFRCGNCGEEFTMRELDSLYAQAEQKQREANTCTPQ